MTDTAKEVDHERIYLQPKCCASEDVGRLWCEHDSPEDCEDGEPWTEYVRADLYAALQSRVEALDKFPRQFMPLSDETIEDIASQATSKRMAVILTFNMLNRVLAGAPQEAP